MSVVGNALNNWLQRQNASLLRQLPLPIEKKLPPSICDMFPPNTRERMISISVDSAFKEREMGAPITHDYTLGNVMTGTIERVAIPRPEGTRGTYHTHPHGAPFPSIHDTFDAVRKNDEIMCIGATGKIGTKIQCFTPKEPKWSEIKWRLDELISDISSYNNKVGAKFKGNALEILTKIAQTEPEWYKEGMALLGRRKGLESIIELHLRYLAYPEEWTAHKWVNGLKDVPYSEAYPNIFNKCRIIWETIKEELPYG